MSRIRSKNTGIELIVRKKLYAAGIRYRLHRKDLPGKPDIVISKARLAIFIDGDFWHGYKFVQWKNKLAPYWREKIERNKKKDIQNTRLLRKMNWRVARFWQHQIKKDPDKVALRIIELINDPKTEEYVGIR